MTYILQEYDDALEKILKHGIQKSNRTGVDTFSIFGMQCRYDISTHFPLLTKRKIFPKSIFAELLWMLSGSTNVNDLEMLGSKIWTPWKDKEFEKKNGYEDGELGPVYGHQFRKFGAKYKSKEKGFDQVAYVIDQLKNNRSSRRIMIDLWNAPQVNSEQVRLPPCHFNFILNVDNNNGLSGMLTQRSADFPVGVPANIQFYSAFIYMLAQQCGLKPKELVHSIADAHIYKNQIPSVEEYLSRAPIDSPKLNLCSNEPKANSIDSYVLADFVIENYNPLPKINVPVEI